ncbi:hypothetical protein BD324DRAFT_583259 [Kockovaella imperatae]|uniref:Mitochondrial protein n=1 Tax=Kockovaella imperatae TaxID=4999 RepID=A0A1Y1U907_9TREE|nr:hypothetical protein BD324DRAFT_583259 [Kockovaella imperatae]ORX34521.1 hypothetical protein BD324DRAFT_583259 [Kockovaella imperatae]
MAPAPTLAQVQTLYNATKSAASKFTTYNFRTHFLRRTDEVFKPVLASLESGSSSSSSPESLSTFYQEHQAELEVLKRSAEVNRMFEGPKLVVEHPRIITGGGGAGMEASQGGGGQPS